MFKLLGGILRYAGSSAYRLGGISPGQNEGEVTTKEQLDSVQTNLQTQIDNIELGGVTEVFVNDGTASNPTISFASDKDTGFFRSASGTVDYSANGTSQVQFLDGGILPTTDNDISLGSASKKLISINLADGSVGALPIRLGADENNGFYGVSDTELGVAIEGVKVASFNTTGLLADVVTEMTPGSGTTINNILLKSGKIVPDNGTVTQTISITTGVTINKPAGIITTVSTTLGALAVASFTVSNTTVTSSSIIIANVCDYSGTFITNGFPIISISNVTTNAFNVNIFNGGNGVTALNGTINISFVVLK